jgi:hypothetical protein
MKKIPSVVYLTADEIEARIAEREAEARTLPPGDARQSILKEIDQLRMYADAKRWIESPGLRPAERPSS